MNNPIILHVNCVEQGQSIEEMCRLAVRWGYEGIEFRRKRGTVKESPEEYLDAIAKAQKASGLKHVLFGGPGPNLMKPDPVERRRELDECIIFYRAAAKRFTLSICNTMTGTLVAPDTHYFEFDKNGSAIATEEQWVWAVEGFQELGDLAAELGFRFAFETHNCFIHDLPEPSRRLVERIHRPSVGINFDFGNIVLNPKGCSLADSFRILADTIYEVHLKNLYLLPVTKYYHFIPCPLADGVINHREFLRHLKGMSYTGPIVIETPREGDREWFAREDLKHLKTLIEEIG